MSFRIGVFFSKKDLNYNLDKFGKNQNLLFITGLVGSGKSTIAKDICAKKEVVILSQDWLAWSEVYEKDNLATSVLNEFYQLYPEARIASIENKWHENKLTLEEKFDLKKKYNNFLVNYAKKDPNNLYIIEGIDVYNVFEYQFLLNFSIIFKRTSALKCFLRRYKRDKNALNQADLKSKWNYLKMVIKESRKYYFRDRKVLNKLINKLMTKEKCN